MTRKYDRLTQQEAFPLFDKFYNRNLSNTEFMRKSGLSKSQFYLWRRHYLSHHPELQAFDSRFESDVLKSKSLGSRESQENKSSLGFGQVVLAGGGAGDHLQRDNSAQIELIYPNGVKMHLPFNLPADLLSAYIKIY